MNNSVTTTIPNPFNTQEYKIGPWVVKTKQNHILNSVGPDRESFESNLKLPSTPEMIWADNHVFLSFNDGEQKSIFVFNALDALKKVDTERVHFKIPAAEEWMNSKNGEFSSGKPYDWTFSTAYDGTLIGKWVCEPTDEGLDQVFIRSQDPILLYGSIDLFEDELGDNGISLLNVKIRVMSSGIFVLQRFFLRIDGSLLRVWDTRLQWRLGDKYILREVKRMDSEKWLPSMVGVDPNGASSFCTRTVEHRFEKLYPGTHPHKPL
nr:TIP41 protein [Hymenolepis microstoma]